MVLVHRAFNEENPILFGRFLFRRYLDFLLKKEVRNRPHKNARSRSGVLLAESFLYLVSDLSYIALLVRWKIDFCVCVYMGSNPASSCSPMTEMS